MQPGSKEQRSICGVLLSVCLTLQLFVEADLPGRHCVASAAALCLGTTHLSRLSSPCEAQLQYPCSGCLLAVGQWQPHLPPLLQIHNTLSCYIYSPSNDCLAVH